MRASATRMQPISRTPASTARQETVAGFAAGKMASACVDLPVSEGARPWCPGIVAGLELQPDGIAGGGVQRRRGESRMMPSSGCMWG